MADSQVESIETHGNREQRILQTNSESPELVLKAEAISLSRGNRVVLSQLSFEVAARELLAFTGPNGIGKTTLLRAIAGLGEISVGKITFDVDECVYLGHEFGLKPELTVAENLEFWLQVYGCSQQSMNTSIPFDLDRLLDRDVRHLSSGQKRKVALATVMLSGSKIWILDEPTAGLDDTSSTKFAHLAEEHCNAGGTVIFSTHHRLSSDCCRYFDLANCSNRSP